MLFGLLHQLLFLYFFSNVPKVSNNFEQPDDFFFLPVRVVKVFALLYNNVEQIKKKEGDDEIERIKEQKTIQSK